MGEEHYFSGTTLQGIGMEAGRADPNQWEEGDAAMISDSQKTRSHPRIQPSGL